MEQTNSKVMTLKNSFYFSKNKKNWKFLRRPEAMEPRGICWHEDSNTAADLPSEYNVFFISIWNYIYAGGTFLNRGFWWRVRVSKKWKTPKKLSSYFIILAPKVACPKPLYGLVFVDPNLLKAWGEVSYALCSCLEVHFVESEWFI